MKYQSKLKHIPVDAPRAKALIMWPIDFMPPSATIGTPNFLAYWETLKTAVPCGLPQAITENKENG